MSSQSLLSDETGCPLCLAWLAEAMLSVVASSMMSQTDAAHDNIPCHMQGYFRKGAVMEEQNKLSKVRRKGASACSFGMRARYTVRQLPAACLCACMVMNGIRVRTNMLSYFRHPPQPLHAHARVIIHLDTCAQAMEVYQVALKLVPDSKELSQKIHSLRNQISKQAKSAKLVRE